MPQAAAPSQSVKPIQIFKPGRHVAMSGQALAFAESDLRATVAAYDPARHEAPIVVGHPKTDAPAYGWIQTLAFADGGIDAQPHQVNPEFAELVDQGAFKKISASFYAPDAPGNPVPGVYYLRHVGFLGAQPPAVKGLRQPSFADAEEGVVEFSEWDDATNAGLWRGLREWILAKFGAEEADKVIPGYAVADLERGAQEEINKSRTEAAAVPAFSDPNPQPETSVTPEQIAALEAENERLRTQIAQSAAEQRHAANVAFADGLVAEGRMLPAARDVVVATLDHLAAQAEPVEFGEGDAKAPLADAYKAMLKAQPKIVEFGEQATRERAAGATAADDEDTQFAEGADPERLAQHKAIRAHMAEHKVDYATAARAVLK